MTVARLALLVALAACQKSECDRMADLVDKCMPALPASSVIEVERFCTATSADQSVGGGYRACAKATTCEELTACFEKHRCHFILTSSDDTEPQLSCF
jgi:hypothetical protein